MSQPILQRTSNNINIKPIHNTQDPKTPSVILFYKYGNLSSNTSIMEPYRQAYIRLCSKLNLKGRILIGLSNDSEGINGTLAGNYLEVLAFTYALHGKDWYHSQYLEEIQIIPSKVMESIKEFWSASHDLSKIANIPLFIIDSPEDFKWSFPTILDNVKDSLFPDLNIKLVSEIISTGGKLSSISVKDTSTGYLTPEEWHNSMKTLFSSSDTHVSAISSNAKKKQPILIDCRNQKEYAIGHFESSINPKTKTFEQFPTWVHQNTEYLKNRTIYMYCTGGIRCEKASAHVRNALREDNATEDNPVFHLKGGIHKYLEKYGSSGMFQGKNFVFDRRVADDPATSNNLIKTDISNNEQSKEEGHISPVSPKSIIVGKCRYCNIPWDTFTPDSICTVCREPTLVCDVCRKEMKPKGEYHCEDHSYLQSCYFSDLTIFSSHELKKHQKELQNFKDEIAIGKKFKQKRKTLQKQLDKVQSRLFWIKKNGDKDSIDGITKEKSACRSCGELNCNGSCWGFHGLARKRKIEETGICINSKANVLLIPPTTKRQRNRPSATQRQSKQKKKQVDIEEIKRLKLSLPPSHYRDPVTSLRCPKPCTRILQTYVKGKWCGKRLSQVLKTEFAHIAKDEDGFKKLFEQGLIRINGKPIQASNVPLPFVTGDVYESKKDESSNTKDPYLKNMDVIGRILHWVEPPVLVPSIIAVEKIPIPEYVRSHFLNDEESIDEEEFLIYCCNKPSTVPTHPAGPYLSNTLTLMVEAQESLQPRSLIPCHRLDRVTSGLTLCCTSPKVARLLQTQMSVGNVSKMYLAKVKGKFPSSISECENVNILSNTIYETSTTTSSQTWKWSKVLENDEKDTSTFTSDAISTEFVEVNAAIDTVDPGNGIRAVSPKGKQASSRFKYISYDGDSDTSLIACYPITGRSHQLRVHLQWIGYPIHNDVQYGGSLDHNLIDRGKKDMCWEDRVLNSIMDSCKIKSECDNSIITQKEEKNARDICLCYQGKEGILKSFTPAQLLQHGHSIALHAWRYAITFEKKSGKRKIESNKDIKGNSSQRIVSEMEFRTEIPVWAGSLGEIPWAKTFSSSANASVIIKQSF